MCRLRLKDGDKSLSGRGDVGGLGLEAGRLQGFEWGMGEELMAEAMSTVRLRRRESETALPEEICNGWNGEGKD
ncbi:uncharacterized protein A4U43_C09F14910 [Asparagus officinalis]|uniref:Uncharacterized protein n=1 Tax=Asparagus officinalis TaxID=4686 RepID=A0A5P1E7S3_ASPOF|nr:uncharacterized protein A4U43_C09F14910 [Asparagus officinalis]